MSTCEKISYRELLSFNENAMEVLQARLKARCWHYTSAETMSCILKNSCFFVRSISAMNDFQERERHPDGDRVHILCFCNTKEEQIAMWYLYSGMLGNGMAMGISPKSMHRFISSIATVYPVKTDNTVDKERPLTVGIDGDFEFRCGWVYYETARTKFKHHGKEYQINKGECEIFAKDNYFIKEKCWEYEREFRFVFINKTAQIYDRIAVYFDADKVMNDVLLKTSSETSNDIVRWQYWGLEEYKGKIQESYLQIAMNLFERNKKEFLKRWLETSSAKDFQDLMCDFCKKENCCSEKNKKP